MDYNLAIDDDFYALTKRIQDVVAGELEKVNPNLPLIELLKETCVAMEELVFRMNASEYGSGV